MWNISSGIPFGVCWSFHFCWCFFFSLNRLSFLLTLRCPCSSFFLVTKHRLEQLVLQIPTTVPDEAVQNKSPLIMPFHKLITWNWKYLKNSKCKAFSELLETEPSKGTPLSSTSTQEFHQPGENNSPHRRGHWELTPDPDDLATNHQSLFHKPILLSPKSFPFP